MSKNQHYYHSRINKSLAYINNHLKEEISIQKLAEESNFSLYHFHRIYRAFLDESPYETLLRLRLEKSIFLLKYEKKLSISEISYECGFPSPENFSRQFKTRFEVSPSTFKKSKELQNSRIYQEHHPNDFFLRIEESRKMPQQVFDVQIERLPKINIAFIRAIFGADGSGLVEKYLELMDWAKQQNIKTTGELTRFGMSIDNPEVTPVSKYRYDFALTIYQDYTSNGIIEFGEIPACDYATIHCIGVLEDVAKAWDFLYKNWLPNSNYIPLHYPSIEEFVKGPEEIGWERFNIKCRIPIIKRTN